MVFTVIEPADDLSPTERRRAHRAGPSAVAVRTSHTSLLTSAGFRQIECRDVTDEYRATLQRWIDARSRHADEIAWVGGRAAIDERIANGHTSLRAVVAGLLTRRLYTAIRT